MAKHKIYVGVGVKDNKKYYFLEIVKNLYLGIYKYKTITRKHILSYLLKERKSRAKDMKMTLRYIKFGCKDLRLIKTV